MNSVQNIVQFFKKEIKMKKLIKQKIVETTITVMQEEDDITKITIRKIAQRAKIGVGLINYHFQTKQNLINQCVRIFIGQIISKWNEVVPRSKDSNPEDHLKKMLTATAQFVVDYPRISKISILNDINNPSQNDNTSQTLEGILPLLHELNINNKPQEFLKMEGYNVLTILQMAFLKAEFLKKDTGFDFFDKSLRENLIHSLVNKLIENILKEHHNE